MPTCFMGQKTMANTDTTISTDPDTLRELATARAETAEAALRDARENGLIYWEPNTTRGATAKAAMLARIDRVLNEAGS
jgi:sialic acid synthase SpsE